jgi:hypothetical protein
MPSIKMAKIRNWMDDLSLFSETASRFTRQILLFFNEHGEMRAVFRVHCSTAARTAAPRVPVGQRLDKL